MLQIHFGNRIEGLADALAATLAVAPPAAPLEPETIVIGHVGMDEWLKRALAERLGIAANLEFQQPAAFVWRMLRARDPDLPRSSPLDRGPLVWRLYAALGEPGQPAEVVDYLRAGDELSRFELAEALAGVFEQYQIYRPEWILDWEAGESQSDAAWQAALWRRIAAAAAPNPARLYRDFFEHAGALPEGSLPARVSVFGISALPSMYLRLLAALAQTREVRLYVPNPSRAYWGDIESEARLACWQLTRPERAEYATSGQPLLAALGGQGRDFIELLNGLEGEVVTAEHFAQPEGGSLLARLQADVLELAEPQPAPVTGDDSLLVHVCHSRRREVEVLHDALLAAFEADPDLGPEDILVMAPNMDDYADHVNAVFDAAPAERHIPWSLVERSARTAHPLVEALFTLLDLPDSRLKASEVLGLLDLPAVARRYELDDDGLDAVHRWTREAGIRWGWDSAHRAELALPADALFSWRFGLDRLLAGYALAPEDGALWHGIAPWSGLEGQAARALGPLSAFAAQLDLWRNRLTAPRPMAEWTVAIRELLNLFLPETDDEQAAVALLRQMVAELAAQAGLADFETVVPRTVIRAALAARLAVPRHPRPFLSGRVTFCALAPMRSIPAKFVWLLGMSEADFPRRGRAPGFDLIAAHPRRGDRARHGEDRALFLEALLSARGAFHLSYIGRSERDNTDLPASVVVNLLLDVIERMGTDRERVVLEHPLQPFSVKYEANPDSRYQASYAREWLNPPRPDAAPGAFAVRLSRAVIPETGAAVIELADLIRGLESPSRRYLEALGMSAAREDVASTDDEPFVLDGLEAWRVKDELLARWLAAGDGFDPESSLPDFAARGWLPPGEVGRIVFRDCAAEVETVARAVFDCTERRAGESRDVNLSLGDWRLVGTIAGLYPAAGLVQARAGALRPADRLALWIQHLALAAGGERVHSRFFATGRGRADSLHLAPVTDAAERLRALCELYARSEYEALPFLPDLSFELYEKKGKGRKNELPDPRRALAGVRARWQRWRDGDERTFIRGADGFALLFRGREEPFGAEFTRLARDVFEPVVQAEAGE